MKLKLYLQVAIVLAILVFAAFPDLAHADNGGDGAGAGPATDVFDDIWLWLKAAICSSLGRALSIGIAIALIVSYGFKGSLMGFLISFAIAVGIALTPNIIEAIFTAGLDQVPVHAQMIFEQGGIASVGQLSP